MKEIAHLLSKQGLDKKLSIDFYGQKTDTYFDDNLDDIVMFEYRGVLSPNEVIPALKRYDALIFPTHYDGEGCPGILVEALSASLPIIASDWKYNNEFVTNGDNGFLCETMNPQTYIEAMRILLYNNTLRKRMAIRAHEKSGEFSATRAKTLICQYVYSNPIS